MLVVESDSSRKAGPAIPLLHTLGVPAGGGTPASAAMTACPSSCSLPPPALSQEGIPGWSWAFLISLSSLLLSAAAPPADYSIENG